MCATLASECPGEEVRVDSRATRILLPTDTPRILIIEAVRAGRPPTEYHLKITGKGKLALL